MNRLTTMVVALLTLGVLSGCASDTTPEEAEAAPSITETEDQEHPSDTDPAESSTNTESGEIVELSLVTFLPQSNTFVTEYVLNIVEEINATSDSGIQINYRGGPEALPPFELPNAVHSGALEMAFVPSQWYPEIVPGAAALALSELSLEEEREPGSLYDVMTEAYEGSGLRLLSRGVPTEPNAYAAFFTNERVESLDDFNGQRMGPGTFLAHGMEALGITPTRIEFAEQYTSLERGVIDGWFMSIIGSTSGGIHEVVDYMIDAPLYRDNSTLIMNESVWQSLDPTSRDVVESIVRRVESDFLDRSSELLTQERDALVNGGVELLTLDEETINQMRASIYDAEWAALEAQGPEELIQELQGLISRSR